MKRYSEGLQLLKDVKRCLQPKSALSKNNPKVAKREKVSNLMFYKNLRKFQSVENYAYSKMIERTKQPKEVLSPSTQFIFTNFPFN